ncbi:MAG: hypothetical protein QG656_601, partial [Candidatus Hydrogenedentes bacterium]|nr:hypothetical protein [Candidatus Hydrogenedentota bacterium]
MAGAINRTLRFECGGLALDDAVNETQECRVYEEDAWYSMIEYVLFLKHRKAYEYACESAMGKRVLDFGCGSGYGTARLAKAAASVIGVDASQPAIAYAQEHYRADNLKFRRIPPDCTLPFDDDTFDMAVSFQVIEHMPDVAAYLRLLKRI